jgi:2-dehydro-3-deoxyphosphooctonate aldolase (KDO 8-P synthase)
MQESIDIGNVKIGGKPFVFIGGPCVIEGRDIVLKIAGELKEMTASLGIPFIFNLPMIKPIGHRSQVFADWGLKKG